MSQPSQRNELLRAASNVVREKGAASLTLDAVAASAGASKGGVLYHFPTKAALIGALIDTEISAFEAAIEAALASEKPGRGAYARAYARATVAAAGEAMAGLDGVLAAVAFDDGILDPYRAKTAEWRGRMVADGLDPSVAELVRLASDGLFYGAAMGAAIPSGAGLGAFLDLILDLAKGGSE